MQETKAENIYVKDTFEGFFGADYEADERDQKEYEEVGSVGNVVGKRYVDNAWGLGQVFVQLVGVSEAACYYYEHVADD